MMDIAQDSWSIGHALRSVAQLLRSELDAPLSETEEGDLQSRLDLSNLMLQQLRADAAHIDDRQLLGSLRRYRMPRCGCMLNKQQLTLLQSHQHSRYAADHATAGTGATGKLGAIPAYQPAMCRAD
jgi:hypothetical protein